MGIFSGEWLHRRKNKGIYQEVLDTMADHCHRIALLNLSTGISSLLRADSEEKEYLTLSRMGDTGDIDYGTWIEKMTKELVHPDHRGEFGELLHIKNLQERINGGEKHQTYIYKCRRRLGGEYRWVQAEYVVQEQKSNSEEVLYYVFDISDRWIAAEKERRRLQEELDRAGRERQMLTDMLGELAGDLRVPVSTIAGINRRALHAYKECRPEAAEHYLSVMNRITSYLMSFLTDIVDLSKVQKNGIPSACECFDIQHLADECNLYCMELVRDRQLSYVWTGELQGRYLGDENGLKLVLFNVMENAVKFNQSGGDVRIRMQRVAGSEGSDCFVIQVRDSGIGISPEHKRELFMPFAHRLHKECNSMYGTGIGLTVAKYILDSMGGHMDIQSEPGAGTVVTICFTLQRAALDERDVENVW